MILSWLRQKFIIAYPGVPSEVSVPPDLKLGDYSSNIAFLLAKEQKQNPMDVAAGVVLKLQEDKDVKLMFEKIDIVPPGFINFFLKPNYLRRQLVNIHSLGPRFGRSTMGNGRRVIIEYPSTNIAKTMHVGHSRPAFIGDALSRIYECLGYDVIRWDYLGDWGTQFGMIIAAYKLWGNKEEIERQPLEALQNLYVRYNQEAKDKPELLDKAREEFRKLEQKDPENTKLWKWFTSVSLEESHALYKELGLLPATVEIGESFYREESKSLVANLLDQGLAQKSEGAVVVSLDEFKLPVALLQKSDGSSLYLTRDIPNLTYRLENYNPVTILYVVANQQALHFEQLFAIAQKLKLDQAELVHVKFGLILGENKKKLASREGNAVSLQNVVKESQALALKAVQEKNPKLPETYMQEVAHAVGIGALKYNDLSQHPYSDITFDWQRMLDFSGNSGPYLQYTYARLASIRLKSGGSFFRRFLTPNLKLLDHELELRLMRHLLDFPDIIRRSASLYTTNTLALYLYELANHANRYYEAVRILDDKKTRDARVFLLEAVMTVLKNGLALLGIQTLERM